MAEKVCIATLGCKLNQYDSEAILARLRSSGYEVAHAPEDADLCVVNTCAVTATAESKTRNLLRRFHRSAPHARLFAVGCMAERDAAALSSLGGVDVVLGNREKERILDFLSPAKAGTVAVGETSGVTTWVDSGAVDRLLGRSRAYLKVQDGCDEKCTYCIVPRLRGQARSRPVAEAVEQAEQLAGNGFVEIVLTGVNLSSYGQDLGSEDGLQELLFSLESVLGLQRIRLGSIEPWGLSESLIRFIAQSEKICPHLHLPIQSADDRILRWMNRRYTASRLRELIRFAFSLRQDWGLGADVIVGFPGEMPEHFANTCRFVEENPFTYLHLFPFSARPGTPAQRLPDRVPGFEIQKRMTELKRLDTQKRRRFRENHIGTVQQIVPESRGTGELASGYTRNYLRVFFKPPQSTMRKTCSIYIEKLHPNGVQGKIVQAHYGNKEIPA